MNSTPAKKTTSRRFVLIGLSAATAAAIGWERGRRAESGVIARTASPVPTTKLVTESGPASAMPAPAAELTREWFAPYLNTEFHLKTGALSTAAVHLIEVSPTQTVTDKDKHVDYTSFSLVFSGSKNLLPGDSAIYHIDHGVLGGMDLFLSPVGKHKDEVRLQAIVSHRA